MASDETLTAALTCSPPVLTAQAACFWCSGRSLPGPAYLIGRPGVQARVGPVVVAVDVAADPASGVVEGFVFVQPHLPLFEFPEPALDEGLRFGVGPPRRCLIPSSVRLALKRRAGRPSRCRSAG